MTPLPKRGFRVTDYLLRELTQIYSFAGLKIFQNNSDVEQNQNAKIYLTPKPPHQNNYFLKHLLN